ncbi:DUF1289 domain-containing protein [Aeromonas enteropelogenes]|uniref:DUF1289 domain-containing protein n=1 Tax=Aeromonas enteropelogenes TaxID=29489 RepID=UPI00192020CF|nr:DUF1289 domain-containing protein [Aeromonas enteropelogenes]MBL0456563.1 DUF1289 domain-containing protein [Aeromonas enteropelogenes]
MEQLEIFPLQSPCIGVCEVNNKGYCKGCLRSREERFNWQKMTQAQQQEVMRLCRDRKRRVEAARRKVREGAEPEQMPQPGWDF